MIRYLLAIALTLAILTAPVYAGELSWQRNRPESEWKHLATGFSIGAGAMGICTETTNRITGEHRTWECFGGVWILTAAAYWLKERRDQEIYAGGKVLDARDIAEGIGGASIGAGLLIPIVGW